MPVFLQAWGKNQVFLTWLLACIVAQTTKITLGTLRERRFDFRWFVGTGGMPSTHAAGVTALSTAIGLQLGFDAPLFAAAVAFTVVTLFDAQGVRRSSGLQAKVLNKMLEDIYFQRRIQEEQIKEFLGHTPTEVFAGMGVGVVTALVVCGN